MGMNIPEPVRTIVATEATLLGWIETARPGDRFTYHIGHLAADRMRETSSLGVAARETLGRIADRVMALVTEGLVIATQRRLDDGRMAYLAIRSGANRRGTPAMRKHHAPADIRHARIEGESRWR